MKGVINAYPHFYSKGEMTTSRPTTNQMTPSSPTEQTFLTNRITIGGTSAGQLTSHWMTTAALSSPANDTNATSTYLNPERQASVTYFPFFLCLDIE